MLVSILAESYDSRIAMYHALILLRVGHTIFCRIMICGERFRVASHYKYAITFDGMSLYLPTTSPFRRLLIIID